MARFGSPELRYQISRLAVLSQMTPEQRLAATGDLERYRAERREWLERAGV